MSCNYLYNEVYIWYVVPEGSKDQKDQTPDLCPPLPGHCYLTVFTCSVSCPLFEFAIVSFIAAVNPF